MPDSDMQILLSKPNAIRHKWPTFFDKFSELFYDSDSVKISSAYVSVDAILYLSDLLKEKPLSAVELIIGMHAKEGFTKSQYSAVVDFDDLLKKAGIGRVYVMPEQPYHGKLYAFANNGSLTAAIIGSSNITNLAPANVAPSNIEADVVCTAPSGLSELHEVYEFVKGFTVPLEDWTPKSFRQARNNLLKDCEGAEQVEDAEYEHLWERAGKLSFKIPLKPEEKSNLNVYFGKGREDKRGRVRPRPWYEVEIIIPANVYRQPGFPYPTPEEPIRIVTDDGWSFWCYRGGDNGKNFRTLHDLKILGMWIKGRLEEAGALKPGEKISAEMLEEYGRNDIDLISTPNPKTWLLSFKQPEY